MIAIRFHHVFGLSIETVQSQPVLGWSMEKDIDEAQVYFFEGSFSEYEENKKKRLGGDLMPKRIKYKKLIR